MIVTPDGTRSTEQEDFDGVVSERAFTVTELLGPSDQQLSAARTAPGIPAIGDAHPSVAGINCVSKSVSATNDRVAIVMCRYQKPTPDTLPTLGGQLITTDASTVEEETNFDINGDRLIVSYNLGGSLVDQLPKAGIARALSTLTFTVYEQTSEADISLRNLAYVEHVNNAAWFGWAEKTWRCEDIQSRPYGQSRTWREVTTVLTYNPRTWRWRAEFINKGAAPADATEGFGFATFDIRELADFSLLPVTPPTAPP